jgi:lipopolysaccharide transport system permease protein
MSGATHQRPLPSIVVEPGRGWTKINLRELWDYRDLLFFLTWRDINVRYKQTVLGAAWAIIQPFLSMIVFSFFFGKLAQIPSEGVPYPIFSFAALLPWQYFSTAMANSANSLVNSSNLLSKVYFPRLLIPLSGVLLPLVDLAIAFIMMIAMMFYFGVIPTWNFVWLPVFVLLAVITSLGIGLWLAALNVHYRDVRYIVPFLVQFGLFISPVVYSSSLLPEKWRMWYGLNPMAGVIEGFRWSLLGQYTLPRSLVAVSALVAIFLIVSGLAYFGRVEKSFADVV